MNTALWIVQGVLAAMFIMAGLMKATTPKDKLALKMPWAARHSDGMIKFIGISQVLISLGLILPVLTGIAPVLTPVAASALALIMILAMIEHTRAKEKGIVINLFVFAMAAFVAYGRF